MPRYVVLLLSFGFLIAETVLFRYLAHKALGSNLSKMGMYARDVYLPLLLGCVLGCNTLLKNSVIQGRFSPQVLWMNITCVAGVALLCVFHHTRHLSHEVFSAMLMAAVFAGLGSAACVWIDFKPALLAARRNPIRSLMAVGAVGSLVCYAGIVEKNWFWLIHVTGYSVFYVLRLLGVQADLSDMTYAVGLRHPLLNASINMSCAGMEAMVFLFFAICLYFSASGDRVTIARFAVISVLGFVFMFAVNIVRIVLFFCVAAWLNYKGFHGANFFSFAFHQNIGWVLYLLAIALFIYSLRIKSDTSLRT